MDGATSPSEKVIFSALLAYRQWSSGRQMVRWEAADKNLGDDKNIGWFKA